MHRVRRILTAPVPDNGSGDVWPKVAPLLLTASAKGVTQLSAAAHPCPAGGKQRYETKSAERQSPGSDAWQCDGRALGPAGCGLLLCHAGGNAGGRSIARQSSLTMASDQQRQR